MRSFQFSNIAKFYTWSFLSGFSFLYTIFAIYLFSRGITVAQLAIYASAVIIFTSIFEVPTGYLADRYSRKLSVALGYIFQGLAFFLVIYARDMGVLLFIAALSGLGLALKNGATESLIYDELRTNSSESTYLKISARGGAMTTFSGAVAAFLGPILYVFKPALPFVLTAIMFAASGLFVLTFSETKPSDEAEKRKQIFENALTLLQQRPILIIMGVEVLVLVFSNTYYQLLFFPKLHQLGLAIQYLGVVDLVTLSIMSAAFAVLPKLLFKTDKANITIYTCLVAACFLILGLTSSLIVALIFGILFDAILAMRSQITSAISNKYFVTRNRAVSLSSMSFLSGIAAALLLPLAVSGFRITYLVALGPIAIIVLLLFFYPRATHPSTG